MQQSLFHPHTTHYRHQNARLWAKTSLMVYQSPEVIQLEVAKWGLTKFAFIDR